MLVPHHSLVITLGHLATLTSGPRDPFISPAIETTASNAKTLGVSGSLEYDLYLFGGAKLDPYQRLLPLTLSVHSLQIFLVQNL